MSRACDKIANFIRYFCRGPVSFSKYVRERDSAKKLQQNDTEALERFRTTYPAIYESLGPRGRVHRARDMLLVEQEEEAK